LEATEGEAWARQRCKSSELVTTLTDESAIAAPAMTGVR
jgi:hypothetical protein